MGVGHQRDQVIQQVASGPAAPLPPRPGPSSQPAASAQSVPEQIRELDELREAGALTDEEFSAKKEELLDGM